MGANASSLDITSWNLASLTFCRNYMLPSNYKQSLIEQLSNGNRIILMISGNVGHSNIVISECYVKTFKDCYKIWISNDERIKLLKQLTQ